MVKIYGKQSALRTIGDTPVKQILVTLLVFSKVKGLRFQFQLRKEIHQLLCVQSLYCSNFSKRRSIFKVVGKLPLNWHFEVFKVNKKDTNLGLL